VNESEGFILCIYVGISDLTSLIVIVLVWWGYGY